MTSLALHQITFGYPSATPLLQELDLTLSGGWTGLVGSNGAGKTTLLRLIAGDLEPDVGSISFDPGDPVIAMCAQRVEFAAEELAALSRRLDGVARRWIGALDLIPDQLEKWSSLSPGERKRWQIAAALAAEPHVLLLDEPTNHLDAAGRQRLEAALRSFRGLGVLVSHDRSLLNELCARTLRVDGGAARLYTGNYDRARASWIAERERVEGEHRSASREEKRLRARLADKRRARAQAEATISTRKRAKGRHDRDARSMAAKNRVANAEARLAQDVRVTRDAAERAGARRAEIRLEKPLGAAFFARYAAPPMDRLLSLETDALRAGERTLARDVSVEVRRGDRIHVAGPNGCGKSTLLHALVERAHIPHERMLYLPQELGVDDGHELLGRLRALRNDERGRVLTLVATLGVRPDRLLASERPSPGEARKLALAFGLGRDAWCTILDEPTNHLDLPSIERLEEALCAYPGAIVLVTHDDALAARCTTQCWAFSDGIITRRDS